MHFLWVGYSVIWYLVQVTLHYKDDKYFSCTFPFFKVTNLFNAAGNHACSPTQISIDILLPAAKAFGLKLAQPTSQNDFTKSIFIVGGWRMYPFNLPLFAPAYLPTQSCKRALFWSRNPAPARNCKPEPDIYFWNPI